MDLIRFCAVVFLLFVVMTRPVSAAGGACSYSKSLKGNGIGFDVSSRPAAGCAVQIISVTARKGGKKVAAMMTDVDYLAKSVKAVDLTGDGAPELAVFSRTVDATETEALDVYWLDGTALRRLMIPALADKNGYHGGDRFQLQGALIMHTIPLYRDGDPAGKPTGGTRQLTYKFKDGALALHDPAEKTAVPPVESTVQSVPQDAQVPPKDAKPVVPPAVAFKITGITAAESGLEIRANGAVPAYKTFLLDKPERIVIDIPGAGSALAVKKIAIKKFGINSALIKRNKGLLRIELDTTNRTFESYSVKTSGNSLYIEFMQ